MTRYLLASAFLAGLVCIIWIGVGFVDSDWLALTVTVIIGGVYLVGFMEQFQFRQATVSLQQSLNAIPPEMTALEQWLIKLDASLQNPVRARIEGERIALPGPVLTPYLVGLLVMLGLLGTFVGMVVTLKGAVLALEGTTELQAIRAGLARPIEGLGLAFGTSVAGIAASAMLGLVSTLNRRDRLFATRILDSKMAKELKAFSLAHHRQETYKALQSQAQTLPLVADTLTNLVQQLEAMGDQVGEKLVANQQQLNTDLEIQFNQLANSVGDALKASLADSGKAAGDSIKPILEEAITRIASETQQGQESLVSNTETQIKQVLDALAQTSNLAAQSWQEGVQSYKNETEILLSGLEKRFTEIGKQHQTLGDAQLDRFNSALEAWRQTEADQAQQRQNQWQAQQDQQTTRFAEQFAQAASDLKDYWQQVSQDAVNQQAQLARTFEGGISATLNDAKRTTESNLQRITEILEKTESLIESRLASEDAYLDNFSQRTQQLTDTISEQLDRLHREEGERAHKAVEQMAGLEHTVAEHLARLGAELEQPMTRLIETASETPKAAADVIEKLRREMSNNMERDNQLLAERATIMEQLNGLLASLEKTTAIQNTAIESFLTESGAQLKAVGEQFSQQVEQESSKLAEVASSFNSGAMEMASLGQAFNEAVASFDQSNQTLLQSLQDIQQALENSATRSDEQLAYYVAQARELIDHSLITQKEIFEQVQQLDKQQELIPSEVE